MKILIEVTTPGNGKTYEFATDDKLSVRAFKEKLIEQIETFENNCISFDENSTLFCSSTHAHIPEYRNLRKAGVTSGQNLLLV